MTRATDIADLRRMLLQRRRTITETSKAQQNEVAGLKSQDRDAEYEEGAQVDLADYTLSHLVETQRRELLLIDGALRRIDEGNYGDCVDCGLPIALDRLEAVPFALRCEEDAEVHELRQRAGRHYAMPTL